MSGYLAVIEVLAVPIACSIVPGRPPCVPGRTNPERGRPDCDTGLGGSSIHILHTYVVFMYREVVPI